MTANEKEEKKGLEITDWIKLVGVVVSILVASTSLLSASGNVPSRWFDFSLIFLLAIIFSVPFMIFAKPISKGFKKWRLKRKRNAIAQKHLAEFRSLVDASKRSNISIRDILYSLRKHYENNIKSSLAKHTLSYDEYEINNSFRYIEKELSESNMTFRDLSLVSKQKSPVF